MPLKFTTKWPKGYGFEIYGKGPCYVTFIEKGSTAHNAGLLPGDQILELDGQDVTILSSEALKTLAKHSREQPPSLEVVSCLRQVHIPFKGMMGYGFTLVEGRPVVVAGVDFGSPAYKAGLRTGDVILEINGRPTLSLDDVGKFQKSGHLSLLTIPIGRASNMIQVNKTLPKKSPAAPRIQRARELHDKMNIILGDDYEKKMAIVGILKQYAEDRDIGVFCDALAVVLRTPHQRRLLKQIRPFVPPNHRGQFDQLIRMKNLSSASSNYSSVSATNKPGESRVVQILRDDGSFGFVIKGSNPAYIESVDAGGPAERAGLQPRDYVMRLNGIDVRRCGHGRLIQLLQDSGTAPTIEILRYFGGMMPAVSLESLSSDSDASSHTSSEWLVQQQLVDKDGRTFKERINFLLTPKERSQLKRSLLTYEVTSDVVELYTDVSPILDTPSKKTLWMFVMTKLPIQHQEYCLHRIDLPQQVLLEVVNIERHGHSEFQQNGNAVVADWESQGGHSQLSPSFQQQTDFLLTSEERSLLKRLLYVYEDDKDIKSLLEEMEMMLDTPSKKTLWRFIIPLLTNQHQDVVRRRLEFKQQYIESQLSPAMDSYIGPDQTEPCQCIDHGTNTDGPSMYQDKHDGHSLSSEDGNESTLSNDSSAGWRSGRKSTHNMEASEEALLKELEETRKVVQEAKMAIVQNTEEKVNKIQNSSESSTSRYITIIPVGYPGFQDANHPFCSREMNSSEFDKFRKLGAYQAPSDNNYRSETSPFRSSGNNHTNEEMTFRISENTYRNDGPYGASSSKNVYHANDGPYGASTSKNAYGNDGPYGASTSKHFHIGNDGPYGPSSKNVYHGNDGPYSTSENVYHQIEAVAFRSSAGEFHRRGRQSHSDSEGDMEQDVHGLSAAESGDSFKQKALFALQELDAVMAAEVSDQEVVSALVTRKKSVVEDGKTGDAESVPKTPAPPPPPPPPPAPGPPVPQTRTKLGEGHMNVKRINWEKMDDTKVGNTVWGQLADSDLEHVVKNLELENQFSTKNNKKVFGNRRQEVCILSPKKAYNMSILLGHLKMSVSEVKHALYSMNEETLSPELLKQLLSYAPSHDELERYDNFTGDVEDMSKPDMFAYEMSHVPGYEQRLQAMLFKATFEEKLKEMKENLRCIKTASYELKHSKKLFKLLELILAMGNFMNKGNVRVGEAAGFHINFLTQLDVTKTSDNKSTFLHILAETVSNKFPEVLNLGDELTAIPEAAKVSSVVLNQELQELRKVLQDISTTLEKLSSHQIVIGTEDRFNEVMGHFIADASDEVQSLLRLQATAMDEFHDVTAYFGEDSKKMGTSDIFGIFSDFLIKFEKAHRHNLMYKRH